MLDERIVDLTLLKDLAKYAHVRLPYGSKEDFDTLSNPLATICAFITCAITIANIVV